MKSNYYISSFFWSTLSKILNAIINFISVPLLLGVWGQADYGVLSLATACNGYMHLLDLGMNTGAIKFYSQWKTEGKINLIYRVAHSNTTFYMLISLINTLGLLAIAIWGERLFNITHEQFLTLRLCLIILALFSLLTWVTTSYNQLLVADKQMAYTQQIQCIISVLKAILVIATLFFNIGLTNYFFFFNLIVALLLIPYAYKCKKDNLIDNFKIKFYWNDFKIVLMYSLSLFALSLFQVTATQSRPLILGMLASNAADIAAEYRIIEVIPLFIIVVGGTLTGIFLPKSSELIAQKNQDEIEKFAYKGTTITTILANILCIPFILGAKQIISAYVGIEYQYLYIWLILWCVTVLIQIHTTPGNSLILAYGKTKVLVYISATSCIISMIINALLCKHYGVGSAVIGYFIYVIIVIGSYYVAYYRKILKLNRQKIFIAFIKPTLFSLIAFGVTYLLPYEVIHIDNISNKITYLFIFTLKGIIWFILYCLLLWVFKIIQLKDKKISI